MKYRKRVDPMWWIIAFLYMAVFVSVVRCTTPDDPFTDGGSYDMRPAGVSDAFLPQPGRTLPPGNLPFGYYERQCQWDACGGPLPVHPLYDPLRGALP